MSKFGYCITGHHAHCRRVVYLSQQDRDITCACPCHADPEETP